MSKSPKSVASGKSATPSDSSQRARFIAAAREAEADQDEEAFKRRLAKVAKAPPPTSGPESKKKPAK
jgi:hypothetical protein